MTTGTARVEDPKLLTGRGTYVAGLDLAEAAHVHYVTSPLASGRIIGIGLDAARAMPGVLDVVVGADVALGTLPGRAPGCPDGTDRALLARDRVRYVGEAVVAVVAETEQAAVDAAELVEVDYEPLAPVVGIDAALDGSAKVFAELDDNIVARLSGGDDDVDLADCEVVVDAVIENQRVAPCPLETRVGAAFWTDDDRLVHRAAGQGSHVIRDVLAQVYGLDPAQVRVITDDVGGSFGAKARLHVEDALLGFLSRRIGRPVRWTPTRSDDMVGLGHSRAQRQRIRLGGDRDGTLRALSADIVVDCGAYPLAGPLLARNTGMILPGPFRIAASSWTVTAVVTNTTPIAAYRGAGRPEAGALLDRAVDLFAAEVGIDPLDIRRRNLRRTDELPWTNPTGLTLDSGDYPDALARVAEAIGYDQRRTEQEQARSAGSRTLPGIGLSTFIDRTGAIAATEYAAVRLLPEAKIEIVTGSTPYGQGHDTTWSNLVAARTGIPVDAIRVVRGDTDLVPYGQVTGGSRSAQVAGSALAEATDALVSAAIDAAADLLEAAPDDVVLDTAGARFHVSGAPAAASVGWSDLETRTEQSADAVLACEAHYDHQHGSVPYGAYAALVTVDLDTGSVSLDRLVTVDDAGTILDPTLALGQVHGGVGQGIGQALYEEFRYGGDGTPLTANLADYLIPSAAEMPSFECMLTEHPSPNNPLGAKGIAESGTIGAVPAIQNAVVDALSSLGVNHIDLPVSPERVWNAIGAASSSLATLAPT